MEWITDKPPELELSLSHSFCWRSKKVLIYHRIWGYQFACMYAGESKSPQWWQAERHAESWSTKDVLGWLPLNTLPAPPKDTAVRQEMVGSIPTPLSCR